MSSPFFTLVLLVSLVGPAAAQTASVRPDQHSLRPRSARAVWVRPAPGQSDAQVRTPLGGVLGPGDRDYRYTGFFVGAGLGVAAVALSVALCSESDSGCSTGRVLLLGPVIAASFGLGGAVVGGLFPKHPPPPGAPSP